MADGGWVREWRTVDGGWQIEGGGIHTMMNTHYMANTRTQLPQVGKNAVPVTDANKEEYVHCVAKLLLQDSVAPEIEAIRKGLFEVLPPYLLRPFSVKEVLLMLHGSAEINVDDWLANTSYNGYLASDVVSILGPPSAPAALAHSMIVLLRNSVEENIAFHMLLPFLHRLFGGSGNLCDHCLSRSYRFCCSSPQEPQRWYLPNSYHHYGCTSVLVVQDQQLSSCRIMRWSVADAHVASINVGRASIRLPPGGFAAMQSLGGGSGFVIARGTCKLPNRITGRVRVRLLLFVWAEWCVRPARLLQRQSPTIPKPHPMMSSLHINTCVCLGARFANFYTGFSVRIHHHPNE